MDPVEDASRTELVLRAEHLLVERDRVVEGGGLLLRGGRVAEVLVDSSSVRRAAERSGTKPIEAEAPWVLPGAVNAHAHLELHGFAGRMPRDRGFGGWVAALIEARGAASLAELGSAARAGAVELLDGGTTCVADVDTRGGGLRGVRGSGLRAVVQREVLDARDPSRTEAAIASLHAPFPEFPGGEEPGAQAPRGNDPCTDEFCTEGVSAHAPFSVGERLMVAVAERARARGMQVSCHWSETPEELAYLLGGEGPLASVLGPSPRRSGLDLLADAGLLGPRTTLIHGNHPAAGEIERIAAAGCSLVHCPGTHAFFGREPFPFDAYRRAGVNIAVGTDSKASNDGFDLRRELVLFAARFPGLSPWELLDLVGVSAARAVGLEGRVGTLAPGAYGDWVLFDPGESAAASAVESWVSGEGRVLGSWVGGAPRGSLAGD